MKKLFVLIDCSGSFCESGKSELQTYITDSLCNASEGIFCDIAEISFFTWSDTVMPYTPYQKLVFGGSSNHDALCEWLGSLDNGTTIIFLSDGLFDGDTFEIRMLAEKHELHIEVYSVGADANCGTLSDIAEHHIVHELADIITDTAVLCRKGV
ncbi:MAG: hypothetical protein K2J36_02300 [Ruminococcus sp.]|nr:hypothetical protein [Ruminococcus sp.]